MKKTITKTAPETNVANNKPKKVRFMGKTWWKNFGKGFMPTMSKLSKAFLLPIALLPIAGVFLGIGATITSNTAPQSVGWYIGNVMNQMGSVAFGNLPVLFCISVALAYTKDSGVAAITAVVGFLVFNAIQLSLITPHYIKITDEVTKVTTTSVDSYKMLWWKDIKPALMTSNLGITSLNTGVFAAIFVGAIAAQMYNKFHQTQLPQLISFFSGTKLVPIVTFVAVIPLSFLFMFTWPGIGIGLNWFGVNTGKLPHGVDSLIFEMIERSLVPLGLHHVFYAPLWWTSAGGSISSAVDKALNDSSFLASHPGFEKTIADAKLNSAEEWKIFYGAQGDQTMMYQIIAHPDWLNFKDMEDLGFNLGRFQSGKFAFMMFGLPMASLAMFLNVPKKNRKEVFGIYFSAAFTCFLTGITEPLEYTFLFVAPWLFYGVHMPLAALSFFLTGFMSCHVAMTVSGGFIDYIVFGLIPITKAKTNPLHILWIGAIMAACYFTFFYFAIYFFNKNAAKKNKEAISLPGMRGESEAHLFTKTDFKQKAAGGNEDQLDPLASVKDAWYEEVLKSEDPKNIKAAKIINYLGGPSNIVDVDACASRLRVTVNDDSKVDLEKIKALGGTTGGLVKNNNVQIVYGGEQEAIKPRMKTILENVSKQEAKAPKSNEPAWLAKVIKTGDKKMIKAAYIIEYLGGPENIVDVDACASRLRVTVKDDKKVNMEKIKSLGGTTGGLIRNNNVQVVYGGEQEAIKPRMIAILEEIKIKK